MSEQDKFYWLIEFVGAIPCPIYITDSFGGPYTCNPQQAIKFDSKDEAQIWMINHNITNPWQPIEHGFGI